MYIYKTTNNVNGKIYIGLSSKNVDENPSYYGSGKIIKLALKKYGKENFTKEIIEECDTFDELQEREIYWIAEYRKDFGGIMYNINKGGGARPESLLDRDLNGEKNGMYGKSFYDVWESKYGTEHATLMLEEYCDRKRGRFIGEHNPNYGNAWSDSQKDSLSQKLKASQHNKGENNVSKRLDVRQKISDSKKGGKNPHASPWLIVHPDGKEERIDGGIKPRLIELGVSYIRFPKIDDDEFRYGTTHEFKIKRLTK